MKHTVVAFDYVWPRMRRNPYQLDVSKFTHHQFRANRLGPRLVRGVCCCLFLVLYQLIPENIQPAVHLGIQASNIVSYHAPLDVLEIETSYNVFVFEHGSRWQWMTAIQVRTALGGFGMSVFNTLGLAAV